MNLYADIYRKIRYVIPVTISNIAIPMRMDAKRWSACWGAGAGAGEVRGPGEGPGEETGPGPGPDRDSGAERNMFNNSTGFEVAAPD
jgi:hypothetical protein